MSAYTAREVNALLARQVRMVTVLAVAQAVVMMTAAGRLDWPLGWRYLFFYLAASVTITRLLAGRDPALLAERVHPGRGVKRWDLVLSRLIAVAAPLAIVAVAGFDLRYGWSQPIPASSSLLALLVAGTAMVFIYRAMRANPFFSGLVRIQVERDHFTVDSGPYAFIRHPGYAAMIVYYLTHPFMLGSRWALVPALLAVALVVIRTALEDRVLQAELPGYRDYAERVRFRLIPGVW